MSTLPPLPEWSLRDDLGELVPSEIRVALRAYATAAISEQAAEVEALRDELRLCCELKREYQEQVASKVDEVEALRADAERYRIWRHEFTGNESDEATPVIIALNDAWTPEAVDAVLDAARAALKEQAP